MDLDLISTDDLMEELFGRFDHAVFEGVKVNVTREESVIERQWKGDALMCCGLGTHIIDVCLRFREGNMGEPNDEHTSHGPE